MTSQNTELDPQTSMDAATRRVTVIYGDESARLAEICISLADAQARLHSARQAEVKNLLDVFNHEQFPQEVREKASARLMEILRLV